MNIRALVSDNLEPWHVVCRVPVLHHCSPSLVSRPSASERQVAGDDHRCDRAAELEQRGVGGVLWPGPGEAVLVDRLGAAGHANILMALVTRHPSPARASMLLRGLAREVGKHPDWRVQSTLPAVGSGDLAAACARLDPVGPAPRWGIYPLVAHAEEHGVVTALLDAVAASAGLCASAPPNERVPGAGT